VGRNAAHNFGNHFAPNCSMALTLALILAIVLLSILSMYLLARDWTRRERQIEKLEKQIADLQQANRQRLPYKSFEELLDAMAALDVELESRKLQTDFLENARGHIANAMKVGTKGEK